MSIQKNPNWEGMKEAGRLVLLSLISYLLTAGVLNNLLALIGGTYFSEAQILIISGLLTTGLKGLDEALHEKGKLDNDPNMTKGLTRF